MDRLDKSIMDGWMDNWMDGWVDGWWMEGFHFKLLR